MKAKFLFLGTGGSMGIPVIGCDCEVCKSTSSFNKRTRPGGLFTFENKKILLDASQDFREQALRHHIDQLDGVILTHAHHDHTAGIDDLRAYSLKSHKLLPLLLSDATYAELMQRFAYIFNPQYESVSLLPRFNIHLLTTPSGEVNFEGIPLTYFTFKQAGMDVNGFRIGDFAFLSDIKDYPESIYEHLHGVKQLVVSALRFTPSPLHFTVDDAIEFATRVGAERTWLTHIAHELEHHKTNAYLPDHIRVAYDGLEIPFTV